MSRRLDKEVSAVTFNLKEQRLLDRTMQTLSIERSYALKLLEVNHRLIKVNYRRLKNRVSKIKSHLKVDEIAELRQLEYEGKFKPQTTGLNISGAVQIAAAAKRLNLGSGMPQRPKTVPASMRRLPARKVNAKSEGDLTDRPNSVTGAFIDAPAKGDARRSSTGVVSCPTDRSHDTRKSTKIAFTENQVSAPVNVRPVSTQNDLVKISKLAINAKRINTSPAKLQKSYSSHLSSRSNQNSSLVVRKSSELRASNDSIESNLGSNIRGDSRNDLLQHETAKTKHINHKRRDFMTRIDSYIEEHPVYLSTAAMAADSSTEPRHRNALIDIQDDDDEFLKRPKVTLHRLPSRLDINKRFSQEEYDRRLAAYWRDLNKCRYLRLATDDDMDYSGIPTLVIEQQQQMRL